MSLQQRTKKAYEKPMCDLHLIFAELYLFQWCGKLKWCDKIDDFTLSFFYLFYFCHFVWKRHRS